MLTRPLFSFDFSLVFSLGVWTRIPKPSCCFFHLHTSGFKW